MGRGGVWSAYLKEDTTHRVRDFSQLLTVCKTLHSLTLSPSVNLEIPPYGFISDGQDKIRRPAHARATLLPTRYSVQPQRYPTPHKYHIQHQAPAVVGKSARATDACALH